MKVFFGPKFTRLCQKDDIINFRFRYYCSLIFAIVDKKSKGGLKDNQIQFACLLLSFHSLAQFAIHTI